MYERNSGKTKEEVLQNQFTAYLKRSVNYCRLGYISRRDLKSTSKINMIDVLGYCHDDFSNTIAENDALDKAIQKLSSKEIYILLLRSFNEISFSDIAVSLDMKYSAVTMIYYRALEKLRKIMNE